MNLRGYRSKKHSLRKIIKKVKPDVLIMNETQMRGRMKVDMKPYECWSKNREKKGGGGVATAVAPALRQHAMGAGEGEGDDEFLVTRIDKFQPALNVINSYGEQRNTNVEEVQAKWLRLKKEMETVRARGEFCLLAGDLNKLIGSDKFGVPGNEPAISPGGHLLRELLATEDWILVNGLGEEVVEGGPYTRQDPATGKESCLDLFVASRELRPYISKLLIDSDRKMAVFRVTKSQGKYKKVFSDHYSCLLTISSLPFQQAGRGEKQVRWNLAKKDGWQKYKELSDQNSSKLNKIIEDEDLTMQEIMDKVDKVQEKIKYKAFGKVTIGKKTAREPKEEESMENVEDIFNEQAEKAMEEIEKIQKENKSKLGRVWDVRKRVIGGKKTNIETNAVENPETKSLVVDKSEIKK